MESVLINGIKTYCFSSREEVIDLAFTEKKSLIAVSADKILNATEQIRNIINRNIGYPDGVGAVMALKRNGFNNATKIPGCELWLDIVRNYYRHKSFYLVGGSVEVITKTILKLKNEFPGINILGYRNGYIKTNTERLQLIDDIILKKPDIVFLAMGSPKQEILMEEMQQNHTAVYQGLGGSFDVYVGIVKRASGWWIKHNLEGAYRLIKQPYKLKRFIDALPFWWYLFMGRYDQIK
jgi:UDP-N-acetyl-D-mannosaminouronate:lipid I N-acetyl-D-mannosaminouronosyltransferase